MTKLFISCGELSGEQHSSHIVDELKKINPDLQIFALGSDLLKSQGVEIIEDYKDYSIFGLTDVIFNLNKILSLKNRIIEKLLKIQPDYVLLVDYGGFNLELAKAIDENFKKHNLKKPQVLEYIAPQIWATRPYRIKKIKNYVDKVLCTLPFEEKIYQDANIPVKYVGNPVLTNLSPSEPKSSFAQEDEILIGLFPGSRKSEIKYMLPLMMNASKELENRNPNLKLKFILAKAPNLKYEILEKHGLRPEITVIDQTKIENPNHKLLSAADCLWLCSGTVTLEAALYTTPYFLSYKGNYLNYTLYLILRIIKMVGLANIINGSEIVKEFIQGKATTENFINETEKWLYQNPKEKTATENLSPYYYEIKNNLAKLKEKLSGYNTAKLVAEEICSNHAKLKLQLK